MTFLATTVSGDRLGAGWRPTAALYRATAFSVLALGLGIVLGRADIAVLAAPVTLGLVLALSAGEPRPDETPAAVASTGGEVFGNRPTTVTTDLSGLRGVQLVSVRTPDETGDAGGGMTTVAGGRDITVRT